EEFGYTGSESAIRAAVHEAKAERKENEVFIPLRFAPGQALQIDWGEKRSFCYRRNNPEQKLYRHRCWFR
ncbi:MAG: hypothetical protein PUG34_06645, partial [Eubacteriales bacterium]|nr:hypothetical protein [Eubacteriales bacterium]